MGSWGSHAVTEHDYRNLANLLSPKAKQATLAAITKFGTLRKGTWNGCVFNAAGQVEGECVTSTQKAAEVFEMSSAEVRKFISRWDRLRQGNHDATVKLREALLDDGEALTGKSREVVYVVHESEQTKLRREFESMVADLDLPVDEMSEDQKHFADNVSDAAGLLFA